MSKHEDVQNIIGLVSRLNNDELNEVITACQDRKKRLSLMKKLSFSVGEEVWFLDRGMKVFGTIRKINRKYIVVQTDERTQWKCSPLLLNSVEEEMSNG